MELVSIIHIHVIREDAGYIACREQAIVLAWLRHNQCLAVKHDGSTVDTKHTHTVFRNKQYVMCKVRNYHKVVLRIS